MNQYLAQQAVEKALQGQWKDAKKINLAILATDPKNIDALNRLSKAYFELGDISKAKEVIIKVLKSDPYNTIALKCSEKLKNLKKNTSSGSKQLSAELFLEEPGKTKTVHLIHPCDKYEIAKLNCADIVEAKLNSQRISITTPDNSYIGKLPDDLSFRIKKLSKLGYKYVFAIKSISNTEIKLFIRETFRPDKYRTKPSFSGEKIDYIPYTPPELIQERDTLPSSDDDPETINDGSDKSDNESPSYT